MNEPITITPQERTADILRAQIGSFEATIPFLSAKGSEINQAVADELKAILDRYLAPEEAVAARPFQRADRPLKAGDRVRLTGENWDGLGSSPIIGNVVTILEIDEDGDGVFNAKGTTWFVMNREGAGYAGELIDLDPEIRVGNTVRVTEDYASPAPNGTKPGVEFKVAEVVEAPHYQNRSIRSHYVTGDPSRRGVWFDFIEKVEE